MGTENNNRNSLNGSLMNVFEIVDTSRRKTVDSVMTLDETLSQTSGESFSGDNDPDDRMLKMTKQEYLESIFGPSSSKALAEKKTFVEKVRFVLTSNYLNVAVIVLVLLDSLCVTIELIIDLENSEKSEALKTIAEVFGYIGFAIISLFVIELEIIDAIIVYVSFILDIVFINDEALAALGVMMSVEKRTEVKMEKLKQGMNVLIKENENLRMQLNKKQTLIDDIFVAYSI